jgi:orotate phosphoribosyltransferase
VSTLADRIREAAVLEGDFVLRSGRRSRFYVDKYRFGTRPDLLAEIGEALAAAIHDHEPAAVRIAAPEVGAIALAAAASLRSQLPFIIVRKAAKEYGTGNRLEGVYSAAERVVVVEDVVTSGGAAIDAVLALRAAGLLCETVLCVVDREEGGAEALTAEGITLHALIGRAALGA